MTTESRDQKLLTHDELRGGVDEAARTSRHDPESARLELEIIIEAADAASLSEVSAGARYALARTLVSLGAAEAALVLIEQAEHQWRAVGKIDEAIRTNLGRMHVLDDLGRHSDAATVGIAMLQDLQDRGDDDEVIWLRAAAEENLGVALGYLGRHHEALEAYGAATSWYTRLDLEDDAARALANRAVELSELARPVEAIDALERALERFVINDDQLWQALCHTYLSQAWITAGRYFEAFSCLDAAEVALTGLDQTTEWLRAQLARARCLESLHLDIEAHDIYDDLVEPLTSAGLHHDLGIVQLGLGTILERSDAPIARARDAFISACATFEQIGDTPMLARACLAAATTHDDPSLLIERAIELLDAHEHPAELAIANISAARHLETSEPTRAADALAAARVLIEPLGVPELQWRLHHLAGRLARHTGRSDEALAEFQAAIALLATIRSSVGRAGVRLSFDGAGTEAADDLIELLLDIGDSGAAFDFTERIRSRGLIELRRRASASASDDPPDELRSTYDRLLTARGPVVAELTNRARRLERTRDAEAALGRSDFDVSAEMPPNAVAYRTVGQEIVAFVRGDGTNVSAIRKVTEVGLVESLIGQLEAQCRRFSQPDVIERHMDQLDAATNGVLGRLHDALLGPIRHLLSATSPLTFFPDGAIAAVPFAALHDGHEYVVERQSVRFAPSVTVDALLQGAQRNPRSVLSVGTTDSLAPMAGHEAEQVGAVWSSATVLCGSDATATNLIDAIGEHDVIHFAGHGLFRPDVPEFSALRLADRWVTAAEMARWQLDGQLVILSACDTGRRRLRHRTRDTEGFPRALLGAGAGGVIANLWSADDAATTELMVLLHRELVAHRDPGSALRSAQLHTIARHRHPYYWGGTTLIGGRAQPADNTSIIDTGGSTT